jgi:MSHA biogenesis protein MshK
LLLASAPGLAAEPLRDPTRPYTPAERARESTPRFVVNAIIVSPERRVAILNGRRLTVGDSLDGATVIAIEKDQLVLEIGGKHISTGLNEGAMRR